jgi:hypothetical protein
MAKTVDMYTPDPGAHYRAALDDAQRHLDGLRWCFVRAAPSDKSEIAARVADLEHRLLQSLARGLGR